VRLHRRRCLRASRRGRSRDASSSGRGAGPLQGGYFDADNIEPNFRTCSSRLVCGGNAKFLVCELGGAYSTLVGRDSDLPQAGLSEVQIPVETRFSAPVHTGPGANTTSYTTGTRSFPGVKPPGRGVDHQPH